MPDNPNIYCMRRFNVLHSICASVYIMHKSTLTFVTTFCYTADKIYIIVWQTYISPYKKKTYYNFRCAGFAVPTLYQLQVDTSEFEYYALSALK